MRAVDFKQLVTAGVVTPESTATVALLHLSSRPATEVDMFRLAQLVVPDPADPGRKPG